MITPRLNSILSMVTKKTIADIGTDHAYIPIRLMQDKKIDYAIACDKNIGPLEIAESNIKKYGFEGKIVTRCADGLSALKPGEVEEIIIAGMGGILIGRIIEENQEIARASELILQPMNAQYELRKKLEELGFFIISEELSREGFKVYNLMRAIYNPEKAKITASEIEYHIPKSLLSHPLCPMLIAKKKREFEKILNGNKNSDNGNREVVEYLEKMLCEIDKIN